MCQCLPKLMLLVWQITVVKEIRITMWPPPLQLDVIKTLNISDWVTSDIFFFCFAWDPLSCQKWHALHLMLRDHQNHGYNNNQIVKVMKRSRSAEATNAVLSSCFDSTLNTTTVVEVNTMPFNEWATHNKLEWKKGDQSFQQVPQNSTCFYDKSF